MIASAAQFVRADSVLSRVRGDLEQRIPPTFFPIGEGDLGRIEVGPELITLIGGAPGAGKTAFTMQAVVDALRLTPDLRVCVCNVEMPPSVLIERQLARLSGIDARDIRYRRLADAHDERIKCAMDTFASISERLSFVSPPFHLGNVAAVADQVDANLLVLDYIQRIGVPGGNGQDRRGAIDTSMSLLRQFAESGRGVIVVSAIGRSKDSRGRNSYAGENLSLASFRESSELEFGADDAFILAPDPDINSLMTLKHLKSRHGETMDLHLKFDCQRQQFSTLAPGEAGGATTNLQVIEAARGAACGDYSGLKRGGRE